MIEIILKYLAAKLKTSSFFEEVYCLAESLKNSDDKVFPAFYVGENNYQHLFFDKFNGVGYFKENGKTTVSTEKDKNVACGYKKRFKVPFKFIGIVPKSKTGDTAFSDETTINYVIKWISENDFPVDGKVKVTETGYETDNQRILQSEYSGFDFTDVHYKYSYFSIEFLADILIDPACIPSCDELPDFTFENPLTFCERVNNCVEEISCEAIALCPDIIEIKEDILALQGCCAEVLTCEVDITFSSESEAVNQGWILGDGTIDDGTFCCGIDIFGIIFAGYQDGIEYTIIIDLTGWTPTGGGDSLTVVIFDDPGWIVITEPGLYTYKRTGTLGSGIISFAPTNVIACLDNFRICTVEAPPTALTCDTLPDCQIIQDIEADIDQAQTDIAANTTNISTNRGLIDALDITVADHENRLIIAEQDIVNLESDKQDTLVSGSNIKTINGNSLVGAGDLVVSHYPNWKSGALVVQSNNFPGSNTIAAISTNTLYYFPFPIRKNCSLNKAGFIYTSGGGNIRIALADHNFNRLGAESGSFATGAGGLKLFSLPVSQNANINEYAYVAILASAAISVVKLIADAPVLEIIDTGAFPSYTRGYSAPHTFASGIPVDSSGLTLTSINDNPALLFLGIDTIA